MAFNKAKAMQEAEKLISQGKISQAIKQYTFILEKDPSDASILNNIGDLYYREKNIPEALKNFHKLADSYMKDGFTLKAIAIYKKINKIDPSNVEPLLKLGELYSLQGLSREAREQYGQAVEFFKKKRQPEKALETYQKILALDPGNAAFRARLAEYCEELGRKQDAAKVYFEAAEITVRSGDLGAAEQTLKKGLELDPQNDQGQLLRARIALSKQDFAGAEKIIESSATLKESPGGRQILLDAYLASNKLEPARRLVVEVFRSKPADFTPVSSFSAFCVEKGQFDAALKPWEELADELMERKDTGPLMDALRGIWSKDPSHLPTLELLRRICERTGDEETRGEVLQALGHAYEQNEEFAKAEEAYGKLVAREPNNETFKGLLRRVLAKQGKRPVVADEPAAEPIPEVEAQPVAPVVDTEQEAMVKEALENSDLFSRYGLIDKAVAELEKVLATYPEQLDIHRRILEICHRSQTQRASQAAAALAQIYRAKGDLANAEKYGQLESQLAAGVSPPAVGLPTAEPPVPAAAPPEVSPAEVDLSEVFSMGVPETPAEPGPTEIPLDLSLPAAHEAAPATPEEFDLSSDLEALTATPAAPEVPAEEAAFNYEDALVEVNFYLDQGFHEEARRIVEEAEKKFPGNRQVADLWEVVKARSGAPVAEAEQIPVAPALEEPPTVGAPELEIPAAAAAELVEPFLAPAPQPLAPEPSAPPPAESPAAGMDMLGSLAGDLASSLEGFAEGAPPVAEPPPSPQPRAATVPVGGMGVGSPLGDLLEELGEGPAGAGAAQEDPETHYNLGVAFREMGLLDEAIGEFQKVVKRAQKGSFPPNFLQACSLLAVCFMDKGMPAIAAKWYKRALEAPDLGEDAEMALQYDLGVAYEQAGDARTALERFAEVYSQNIDYRDVAEKIRTLQQKAK
jgi:tetratricopeptide (TPR) repeat protein